jgi:RimJ/RimL family protein N-acetyltransferase
MPHPYWPLFDLVVHTPRLELRYPDDALLVELAAIAANGVHDPSVMPFSVPWTRASSPALERESLKHWWGLRAAWSAERWNFPGAAVLDGKLVGMQNLASEEFGVTRAVSTGSWVGRTFQGQGIGMEMRQPCCTWPSMGSVPRSPTAALTRTTRPPSVCRARWAMRRTAIASPAARESQHARSASS